MRRVFFFFSHHLSPIQVSRRLKHWHVAGIREWVLLRLKYHYRGRGGLRGMLKLTLDSPGIQKDVATRKIAMVTRVYHSLKLYVFFYLVDPLSVTDPAEDRGRSSDHDLYKVCVARCYQRIAHCWNDRDRCVGCLRDSRSLNSRCRAAGWVTMLINSVH